MTPKIIKRDDAELFRSVDVALQSARDTAVSMLEAASAQATAILEATQARGKEDAQQERDRLIAQAIAYREDWFRGLESELPSVVANAVRVIFAQYEEDHRLAIAVSRALAEMRQQKSIVVRVHPSRHSGVRNTVDCLIFAGHVGTSLTVEADASLEPNACVLTSSVGMIETSLESQIQALEEGLRTSSESSRPA